MGEGTLDDVGAQQLAEKIQSETSGLKPGIPKMAGSQR
jgi:hypothetical protein